MTMILITPAQHQQILEALHNITKHFGFTRLHESTLADTTVRGDAHKAITLLRSLEPQEPCAWITEWISRGPQRGLEFWEPESLPGRKITPLYKEPTK